MGSHCSCVASDVDGSGERGSDRGRGGGGRGEGARDGTASGRSVEDKKEPLFSRTRHGHAMPCHAIGWGWGWGWMMDDVQLG